MSMRSPIRHGEVLLVPVDAVPAGAAERTNRLIVGHSESGHHHVLESDRTFARTLTEDGQLYVDLDAPTPLRHLKAHQAHRELRVPAGRWRVVRKREFDVRAPRRPEPDPPVRVDASRAARSLHGNPGRTRPVRD